MLLEVVFCALFLQSELYIGAGRGAAAASTGSNLAQDRLRIGAFNIQVFGVSKLRRDRVLPILTDIVQRYDVILIQEIRDSSQVAIVDLLNAVNNATLSCTMGNPCPTYNMSISDRLGRTSSKEQYAFFYRTSRVEIISTYQFEDPADVFQREPYTVHVRSKVKGIPDFFLTGLHAEPGTEVTSVELNALVEVYNISTVRFKTNSGVLLGDFNADCQYLSNARYSRLKLVTDSRFTWLINEDTTTGSTVCAYDRIIVAGSIGDFIASQSAQVFRFDIAYSLSAALTSNVSDHYPVEFQLQAPPSDSSSSCHHLSLSLLLFVFIACVFY